MAKTRTEKIESIQTEIQQLENQRKKLIQQEKEQERKARTKRLIERGAILESLIPNAAELTNEQIQVFLGKTITSNYAVKALTDISAQAVTATADKPQNTQGQPVTA